MMWKGGKKAKQTCSEREDQQNGFTADFIRKNTSTKSTNQPASEHERCGKARQNGIITN